MGGPRTKDEGGAVCISDTCPTETPVRAQRARSIGSIIAADPSEPGSLFTACLFIEPPFQSTTHKINKYIPAKHREKLSSHRAKLVKVGSHILCDPRNFTISISA